MENLKIQSSHLFNLTTVTTFLEPLGNLQISGSIWVRVLIWPCDLFVRKRALYCSALSSTVVWIDILLPQWAVSINGKWLVKLQGHPYRVRSLQLLKKKQQLCYFYHVTNVWFILVTDCYTKFRCQNQHWRGKLCLNIKYKVRWNQKGKFWRKFVCEKMCENAWKCTLFAKQLK